MVACRSFKSLSFSFLRVLDPQLVVVVVVVVVRVYDDPAGRLTRV